MERIITSKNVGQHRIEKYHFKTLMPEGEESQNEGGVQPYRFPELKDKEELSSIESPSETVISTATQDADVSTSAGSCESDPAFEEMLKRVDELSSELVKTQMQLEKAEAACEERMKEAKEEGYNAIREILKAVDKKDLMLALKSAPEELKERFLSNMSQRAREAFEEEMQFMGAVKVKEVEAAQRKIVEVVQKLAEEGVVSIGESEEMIE